MELERNVGVKVAAGVPPIHGDNPEKATTYLWQAGDALRKTKKLAAWLALQIGYQLQIMQAEKFWSTMERRDYSDQSNPLGVPAWPDEKQRYFVSFEDFLTNGSPQLTGVSQRTARTYMRLAASPELRKIGPEINEFQHMRNALELVRVDEKDGEPVTTQMRNDAKTMTHSEFVATHKLDRPVIAATVEAGGHKEFLLEEWINRLDTASLKTLRDFIERALPHCGDNANDVVDTIVAAVGQEWQGQEAHERAKLTE